MHSRITLAVLLIMSVGLAASGPAVPTSQQDTGQCDYLNFKTPTPEGVQAGGIQMIPLREGYQVWTKRFGSK